MTGSYYKVWQELQSTAGITKSDKSYYKVWQVFQSVMIITKWDVTTLRRSNERNHLCYVMEANVGAHQTKFPKQSFTDSLHNSCSEKFQNTIHRFL